MGLRGRDVRDRQVREDRGDHRGVLLSGKRTRRGCHHGPSGDEEQRPCRLIALLSESNEIFVRRQTSDFWKLQKYCKGTTKHLFSAIVFSLDSSKSLPLLQAYPVGQYLQPFLTLMQACVHAALDPRSWVSHIGRCQYSSTFSQIFRSGARTDDLM